MTTETTDSATRRTPGLLGQTVVVIGGSAGIGLETARLARAEGADVIVTGRDPERLEDAARELGALSRAAIVAADLDRLAQFFGPADTRSTTAATSSAPRSRSEGRRAGRRRGPPARRGRDLAVPRRSDRTPCRARRPRARARA